MTPDLTTTDDKFLLRLAQAPRSHINRRFVDLQRAAARWKPAPLPPKEIFA